MNLVKSNYRNLNSLFDEFFNTNPTFNRDNNWNVVPVNIHETKDAYELDVIAPGLHKEDIKVNVEKGLLTVSYEKTNTTESNEKKTHRKEFSFTSFKRSFTIDDKINTDNIAARYENGVLKLVLPKKDEVKISPKEITIQ